MTTTTRQGLWSSGSPLASVGLHRVAEGSFPGLLALNADSVYVRVPLEGPTQMLPGAEMIHLRRQELDVWLGEPDDFVLAVLRDLYEHETDVERWLNMPHDEFGGRSAVDLLSAGHVGDVEALLVEQWNAR